MQFPVILKEKKTCDSIKQSIFTWRSLVKKTRFSSQHFGVHEAWPGQILRHRKIIYIQMQLLNYCSPRSLLGPSRTLISDLHLCFTAFWRGLQPGSAKRWTIHHCLWLIDSLAKVPPSMPLSALRDPCHSPCVRCHLHPTDSPSHSPFRNLRQIPQTPFSPSGGSCHHYFCSGFTSSQSTAGKAATWGRFPLSATPQNPVQCFLLTHPISKPALFPCSRHWLYSPYTPRCFPEPLSLRTHSQKWKSRDNRMVWVKGTLETISFQLQSSSRAGDFLSEMKELGFLGFGNEAHPKLLTRGAGAAMDHFGAATEAALSWFTEGGWDVASCGTQCCSKATRQGKRCFKITLPKVQGSSQFTFSSGNVFFSKKGFVFFFQVTSHCAKSSSRQQQNQPKAGSLEQQDTAQHPQAASCTCPHQLNHYIKSI